MTEPGFQRLLHPATSEAMPRRLRALISFYFYRNVDIEAALAEYDPPLDVFADSGAFSAYTQGAKVDVDEYAEWRLKYRHLFSVYANLDVRGDWEAGLRNLEHLRALGLDPLPVYHGGEPWEVLEEMVAGCPYVGVGGIAGTVPAKSESSMRLFVKCFQVAAGRAALHGFGITDFSVLASFPWWSVDSSSWGSAFRYGAVNLFNERKGKFDHVDLRDSRTAHKNRRLLRAYGFDPADFGSRERNTRALNCTIAALSYMRLEGWLRQRWGTQVIPGSKRTGLRIYLGDGGGLGPSGNFWRAQAGLNKRRAIG